MPRRTTKGRTFSPEPLSKGEVQALIRAGSSRAPTGIRNRALIAVLWRGGLRISEALALKPVDVDLITGSVAVLNGKGRKRRVVGVDDQALALLGHWLDRRRELGVNGHRPIFCTLAGGPLSAVYVRAMLKRYAARAGIERRVHPHGLRHTMAAELVTEGVPLTTIQAQLGHASLDGTAHYLRRINPVDLVASMRERPTWTA